MYFHPEFGAFSPTARFRREMRLVSISLAVGSVAGALAVTAVVNRSSNSPASEVPRVAASEAASSEEQRPGHSDGFTAADAATGSAATDGFAGHSSAAPPHTQAVNGACLEGDSSQSGTCLDRSGPRRSPKDNDAVLARIPLGTIKPAGEVTPPATSAETLGAPPQPQPESPDSTAARPTTSRKAVQKQGRRPRKPDEVPATVAPAVGGEIASSRAYKRQASGYSFWSWSW
jgi:hypothetical protein